MKKRINCIGILTSGGDCPGLNAAIRAVSKTVARHGVSIVGILDGFTGLIQNRVMHLGPKELSGILTLGGTILGTSRNKPHKMPLEDGEFHDMTGAAIENYNRLGLDCLVCLGGNGTQKNAYHLMKEGNINVVTLPKTIDNDIYGTDQCFGFDTGMTIACEAIDRLHTTASSHHRIMLVDVMGHNSGWLALAAGLSGGADVILIPEIPYDIENVAVSLLKRKEGGKRFSIVVVAEGATSIEDVKKAEDIKNDGNEIEYFDNHPFFPHKIPTSELLAGIIEKKIGLETRVTSLGYLQRGGIPTPTDRVLATQLGTRAGEAVLNNEFGVMIAVEGAEYLPVPLKEVAGKKKLVPLDDPLVKTARLLGISLGD